MSKAYRTTIKMVDGSKVDCTATVEEVGAIINAARSRRVGRPPMVEFQGMIDVAFIDPVNVLFIGPYKGGSDA